MTPNSTPTKQDEVYMPLWDMSWITSQPPVSVNTSGRHNQTNGYTAFGQSMPLGPQPGHYVGVRDFCI